MKIEKLKNNKLKFLIPVLVIVLVISTIFILKTSHSKYQFTKSYNLASGTINYTLPDLNVVAMYQQVSNGSTSYKKISIVPTGKHTINTEKSYCGAYNANGGIDKDSTIILSYVDGGVLVKKLKKGTRCIVYFDIVGPRTSNQMLAELRRLNGSVPASSGSRSFFDGEIDSGSYTYEAPDDLGTSYYFAGAVNTNWVKLGSTYWRIIRINGDGTVRLIYSGTTAPTSSTAVVMTGEGTQIGISAFNNNKGDNAYIGYMYGGPGQDYWTNTHANTNNSNIKGVVDTWYESNKSNFESYIDTNVGFCGDRLAASSLNGTPENSGGYGPGYGTRTAYYAVYLRLQNRKKPDLTCNESQNLYLYNHDLYTMTGASRGNKALSNPVGLITADEVALAGGVYNTENNGYYLYTNQPYWTISPVCNDPFGTYVWSVQDSGFLHIGYEVDNALGVRPVINLKSSLIWNGKGTWDSPFIVSD